MRGCKVHAVHKFIKFEKNPPLLLLSSKVNISLYF